MCDRDSLSADEREYFLSLNRQWIGYDNGYWVTCRVTAVQPTEQRPHGFQYSFSLHDGNDDRILGFNNAHTVDVATGPARRSRRPIALDHINRKGRTRSEPYKFVSPYKLVEDFFSEVEKILKKEGVL
jgi:hypothetical protein